jgi:hypothetical protein
VNRKEAFDYLISEVAVDYRPRRMPWEHDQDSPEVQRQVLVRWVDTIAQYSRRQVEEAFSALMRHQPNAVPTLNEASGQLRRVAEADRPFRVSSSEVLPPQTGFCVAYEAYCKELARQGRSPDETKFTKKFNAMFGV